jgi:hypothetical protein
MNIEIIWKDVPGLEGIYQASYCGKIKSVGRIANQKNRGGVIQKVVVIEKILSQMKTPGGYMRIGATYNGIRRKFYVHVLLAKAFVPNPKNKPCVNHKNGIKTDNRIENLEWVSIRENALHGFRNKKNGLPPGIYFHSTRNRYQGAILVGKKRHQIGDHKNLEDAIHAYENKLKSLGVENSYSPGLALRS